MSSLPSESSDIRSRAAAWLTEARRIFRFAVVGVVNTAWTAATFALLATWMDPRLAYSIVYAAGVAATTIATSRWVFSNDRVRWRRAAAFVGWYLSTYLVGLAVVHVLTTRTAMGEWALAATVVVVTAPLNFVGGRIIFGRHSPPPKEPA